jgi:L-alanine-DL-glutamate epimerase-like enolase superfamily enzyme
MRIIDIRERPVSISRYRDPRIPTGGLTTSLVAIVTDVVRTGRPVVGYGFASIGRYAQSGLIRERFAPRLLQAAAQDITTDDGANLDPFRAWTVMMTGEKPGGHGERCVAVGTLDMALWDAAAKIANGWPRGAFWPHGGHLFSLHLVAALGLGGAEINPLAFHPFHGPLAALPVNAGRIHLPDVPGIGFELHDDAWRAFRSLTTPRN